MNLGRCQKGPPFVVAPAADGNHATLMEYRGPWDGTPRLTPLKLLTSCHSWDDEVRAAEAPLLEDRPVHVRWARLRHALPGGSRRHDHPGHRGPCDAGAEGELHLPKSGRLDQGTVPQQPILERRPRRTNWLARMPFLIDRVPSRVRAWRPARAQPAGSVDGAKPRVAGELAEHWDRRAGPSSRSSTRGPCRFPGEETAGCRSRTPRSHRRSSPT
jgi:hypothetical protein